MSLSLYMLLVSCAVALCVGFLISVWAPTLQSRLRCFYRRLFCRRKLIRPWHPGDDSSPSS